MPVGRGGLNQGKDVFARYPSLTYSTIPEGLMLALVSKQVGRNGWAVMVALCRKVYADGRLGRASAEEIARRSGLILRRLFLRDHGAHEDRRRLPKARQIELWPRCPVLHHARYMETCVVR